jgi:hypothetical protein
MLKIFTSNAEKVILKKLIFHIYGQFIHKPTVIQRILNKN